MRDDAYGRMMWYEFRSWPPYAQIGAGVVAVGSLVLAFALPALAGPHYPDESAWPDGELPVAAELADSTEDPATEDGADLPEGVGVYDGDPLWSHRLDADSGVVSQVDQGILVRADGSLRLVADGATVWEYVWGESWEGYPAAIGVAGEVVVVSRDGAPEASWPGRQDTVALDLDTGEEVWRDEEASFVTVFSDAVMMSECTGEQDGRVGDCTLYARDPLDLSTLWSTPTYANVQVLSGSRTGESLPDRLLIESFPTGQEDRTVSVLDADGDEIAETQTRDAVFLDGDMMVLYEDYDDNPADGCTLALAGYRLSGGGPQWEIEADTWKTADLASCRRMPTVTPQDGKLPLTIDGAPTVVDLATGEAALTVPGEGRTYALSSGPNVLVTAALDSEEDNLTAYDIGTGEVRWHATATVGRSTEATTVGSTLWIYGSATLWDRSDYGVIGYHLGTGEGAALPGGLGSFIPEQIVMSDHDGETPELTAWPADLWS